MTSNSNLFIFQAKWRCVYEFVFPASNMEKKKAIILVLLFIAISENVCEGKRGLVLL